MNTGQPRSAPLAAVLAAAVPAWLSFLEGQTIERAVEAALSGQGARDPVLAGALRAVVSTAVRRRAVTGFLVGRLAQRPPDAPVRALLEVALAQVLAGSYADFTLVDQAVAAARLDGATASAGGFVNAVLRSFLRGRAALEEAAGRDPARRWNLPEWWWRRLEQEYGTAAPAIAAAQLEEPPMILRVNLRRFTMADALARLSAAGLDASVVGATALWLKAPLAVDRIPGFAEGEYSVQDAGAQLAAPWLGVEAGMRVLDACAAPGGKTAHLLESVDCRVDAVEIDPQRAQRIEATLARLGLRAQVHVADALEFARSWDAVPFDRILLDAPCSASGVVRRHPDAPWLRRAADVAKLATQQAKMLDVLWPLLAPAGRLLYVVCSVFAEEGPLQVASFLRRQPDARLRPLVAGGPAEVQMLPVPTASAAGARTGRGAEPPLLPALHDGFYYALLEKSKSG